MKKILSALALLTIGTFAFPQTLKSSSTSENPEVSTAVPVGETVDPASVSSKAVDYFKKMFKNATDAKWYEMSDGYRANFTQKGVRCRLDYDKNGNWLHTIRYYDESKLPVDVRQLVSSSYPEYSIRAIEAIEAPRDTKFHVIHLEGATNWINIKVADGEINELERVKKS